MSKRIINIFIVAIFLIFGGWVPVAAEYQTKEIYDGLREQVLSLQPEHLGLKDTDEIQVLALLMETGYDEAVATLVATSDGTASIYFSNGGGMLGVGGREDGKIEALKLIDETTKYIQSMTKTAQFPLPAESHTKYYAVTNKGVFTVDALEEDFGYKRHPLSPIFHQGHRLISFIRYIDEQRTQKK